MRVLHLMRGSEEVYGAERVIFAELEKLRLAGVDARFLMLQESRLGEAGDLMGKLLEEMGVPVVRVPVDKAISTRAVTDLRRAIEREAPQVVHTHGYKGDVYGLLACRLAKVPVVGEIHGWLFPRDDYVIRFYEWLDVQALKRMDAVIVLADHYRRMILRMGFQSQRIKLIPSGVDVPALKAKVGQADLRQRLGIAADRPVIGMLTRLSHEKGVDLFLRAFALVRRRHPRAVGVVFGDGPERQALAQLAAELELGPTELVWAGYCAEAMDALCALDVVAQTSRTEALPQALMEAMVMERPVVVTAVGGCPELVQEGETGYVVPSSDPETIAARLCHLIEHPDLALRMGRSGAARIAEGYTMQHWVERTLRVYETLSRAPS
ncbi:MAG: glycosyltransferase [Deltaproteobacteria bacterium]|nr:glycosyltransferase [Deltaproteobacteria bacterium]